MSICFTCGNLGLKEKECPDCGRIRGSMNLSRISEEKVNEFLDKVGPLIIPEHYLGKEWKAQKLREAYPEKLKDNGEFKDQRLVEYINTLELIHNVFVAGRLPKSSAFVVAPAGMSKITWAYSCMQFALANGHTVAPLLDTMEANRLIVLGSQDLKYKLQIGPNKEEDLVDYESYINAEVLFLTVTLTEYRKSAFSVIRETVSRRDRKGLRTFVVSEYSMKEVSHWDFTGNFIKLEKVRDHDNGVKHPAVFGFTDNLFSREE